MVNFGHFLAFFGIFRDFGALFSRKSGKNGHFWAFLGHFWAKNGHFWAIFGPFSSIPLKTPPPYTLSCLTPRHRKTKTITPTLTEECICISHSYNECIVSPRKWGLPRGPRLHPGLGRWLDRHQIREFSRIFGYFPGVFLGPKYPRNPRDAGEKPPFLTPPGPGGLFLSKTI